MLQGVTLMGCIRPVSATRRCREAMFPLMMIEQEACTLKATNSYSVTYMYVVELQSHTVYSRAE